MRDKDAPAWKGDRDASYQPSHFNREETAGPFNNLSIERRYVC